jgi:hypothetical protein
MRDVNIESVTMTALFREGGSIRLGAMPGGGGTIDIMVGSMGCSCVFFKPTRQKGNPHQVQIRAKYS